MKKALVLSLAVVLVLGAMAFALPYLDVSQYLIPTSVIPEARIQVGWVFALGQVYELDCPEADPCGGVRQFGEMSMCGDLYFGVNDFWIIPRSPFIGLILDFEWWAMDLEITTELGLSDNWNNFPLTTPPFDYWNTTAQLKVGIVDWFSFRIGSDFIYDSTGPGTLDMNPFIGFRVGDQYGCPDCP